MDKAAKEIGVTPLAFESKTDNDYAPNMQTAISEGCSLVVAVGFKLAGESDINANPKDTHDYPDGVWTLPPTLTKKDVDRDKYLAIGESDRMTLKFVKPAH